MLFSSITFLYYFLPILLIIYFLVPSKLKNSVILLFSLIFYFFGEPKYIIVLLLSCIINYILGKLIEKKKNKKIFLLLAILYNVGQLIIFKYTDFFVENINNIINTNIPYLNIIMPIGISFFTFQALSYVIDIYNKKHSSAKTIFDYATYICFFPQLIAGPIVRFQTIEKDLYERKSSYKEISKGIKLFIIGLSKKVIIANVIGEFTSCLSTKTILASWLRQIGYTLQIYFDFSGYSDMAIGLGLILGFHFLNNFNYPLIAKSITDFWSRWHISLSTWFKDYIYIPLGGNRVSKPRLFFNLAVVWFLTGFWHGASWNFIIWGLYFLVILIIEKIFLLKYLNKMKVLNHVYTLIIVIISFLIFNTVDIKDIIISIQDMINLNSIPFTDKITNYYLRDYIVIIILASILSTPLIKIIIDKITNSKYKKIYFIAEPVIYMSLLILNTAFLIDASFNPFLYFRF